MNLFQKFAGAVNKVVLLGLRTPGPSTLLGKSMVVITYTGRRSGTVFSLPVTYKRHGDVVDIGVAMPDKKNWWRNFLADGGPITVAIDGRDRAGHAVARRSESGQVSVQVTLDE